MTDLKRFLAWFDGYSENIEGAPSEKQWARIKEEIGKISEGAATAMPYKDPSPALNRLATDVAAAAPAGPVPPPPASPDLLKQLADLKAKGRAAAAVPGGQAMSAGV